MSKFVYTNTGFRMEFSNGLTASVQWGKGTFSTNRFAYDATESKTAEVAVMSCNGFQNANMFVPADCCNGDDDVVGYLTPDEVIEFLMNVKNFEF